MIFPGLHGLEQANTVLKPCVKHTGFCFVSVVKITVDPYFHDSSPSSKSLHATTWYSEVDRSVTPRTIPALFVVWI